MKRHTKNHSERGTAIVEFAITAAFFLMIIMAIISGGHLFFTHNAMVESTRRGARYAATQCKPALAGCIGSDTSLERVKNVVLYGTPTAGSAPLVNGLTPANIQVDYSNDFGVAQGTVSVKIVTYTYTFAVAARVINMPPYQTTVVGESAGFVPELNCPE
ncbi:MAG TPA: TadE family protein [Pyrinomonadaceae bacterium]|jgi:Flp pilus assembly protein TadG|nr:TadE family protein [Pyrinomonadaceae bacterium]